MGVDTEDRGSKDWLHASIYKWTRRSTQRSKGLNSWTLSLDKKATEGGVLKGEKKKKKKKRKISRVSM